jgi:ribose transport system permease protein
MAHHGHGSSRAWRAHGLLAVVVPALAACGGASSQASSSTTASCQGLAALILGGTTPIGARGDYWRTVVGALFLTELTTVLDGFGLGPAPQQIVFGLLILVAVSVFGREPRLRDRL